MNNLEHRWWSDWLVIIYQYRWLLAYFCINSGGQVGEKIAAKFFLKSKREEQIHCLLQNAGQTHFRSNWALCSPWTKNKFDTPSLARQSYIIIIKRFVLKWISLAKWPTLPSSSAVLFLSAGDVNAARVQRRSLNFICWWKTRLFVWRARWWVEERLVTRFTQLQSGLDELVELWRRQKAGRCYDLITLHLLNWCPSTSAH